MKQHANEFEGKEFYLGPNFGLQPVLSELRSAHTLSNGA
jgi:hypothetical protein